MFVYPHWWGSAFGVGLPSDGGSSSSGSTLGGGGGREVGQTPRIYMGYGQQVCSTNPTGMLLCFMSSEMGSAPLQIFNLLK